MQRSHHNVATLVQPLTLNLHYEQVALQILAKVEAPNKMECSLVILRIPRAFLDFFQTYNRVEKIKCYQRFRSRAGMPDDPLHRLTNKAQ